MFLAFTYAFFSESEEDEDRLGTPPRKEPRRQSKARAPATRKMSKSRGNKREPSESPDREKRKRRTSESPDGDKKKVRKARRDESPDDRRQRARSGARR